jgi:hypothetical protein
METDSLTTAEKKPPKLRWYHPRPSCLLVILLVVEGVLLLSERIQWFPFNEHKGWTVLIAIASVIAMVVLMLLWFVLAFFFRWRFQFSIRSLLMLTIVVAIPCSWLAVEIKQAKTQQMIQEEVWKAGGSWKDDISSQTKPIEERLGLCDLLGHGLRIDFGVV